MFGAKPVPVHPLSEPSNRGHINDETPRTTLQLALLSCHQVAAEKNTIKVHLSTHQLKLSLKASLTLYLHNNLKGKYRRNPSVVHQHINFAPKELRSPEIAL